MAQKLWPFKRAKNFREQFGLRSIIVQLHHSKHRALSVERRLFLLRLHDHFRDLRRSLLQKSGRRSEHNSAHVYKSS